MVVIARLFGPRKKMNVAIARWHSNARPSGNDLEQAYADKLETEMQEMAIQLHQVKYFSGYVMKTYIHINTHRHLHIHKHIHTHAQTLSHAQHEPIQTYGNTETFAHAQTQTHANAHIDTSTLCF